jgi:hypothetical protein
MPYVPRVFRCGGSGALMMISGAASARRCWWASVPGTSPCAGWSGSILSTTVFGIGVPPGVTGRSLTLTLEALRLR